MSETDAKYSYKSHITNSR